MPKAEKVFTVEKPLEVVWGYLNDLVWVGSCLPGCEKVQVFNDIESEWTVKVKVGPISKTLQVRARTTESRPPHRAAFVAEGQEMRLEGSLDLRALSPQRTEVTYRSNMQARGPLEKLLNQIMDGRIDGEAEAFAQEVRARIEGASP